MSWNESAGYICRGNEFTLSWERVRYDAGDQSPAFMSWGHVRHVEGKCHLGLYHGDHLVLSWVRFAGFMSLKRVIRPMLWVLTLERR